MNQKTEAEILCNCLEYGLVSLPEVISWADGLIEQSTKPDIAIIEVSMAGHIHTNDVIKLLKQVPGVEDSVLVHRGMLGKIRENLQHEPEFEDRAVRILFDMAIDGKAPDTEAESEVFWFYDAMDLTKAGYVGDVEDIRKKLNDFLTRYSASMNHL